jgi:hypothetical protein
MAGPQSNYADEILAAIQQAQSTQLPRKNYALPNGASPQTLQDLQRYPEMTVPADVASIVQGMQNGRK